MATSFNDCLKRGCHVVYALEVEGIPYLFIEKALKRVTAESDVSSPGFIDSYGGAVVEGLIVDGQKVNDEIDREKGVARSRALNFRLAYEPLEDAGVIDNLFPFDARRVGSKVRPRRRRLYCVKICHRPTKHLARSNGHALGVRC